MTDPWAEKPGLFVEKLEHEGRVYFGELNFTTEDEDEWIAEIKKFDVWLEKVREHGDYYEKLAAEFAELYADAQEKAEKWDKLIDALSKDIIDRDDLVNLEYGPEELQSSEKTEETQS